MVVAVRNSATNAKIVEDSLWNSQSSEVIQLKLDNYVSTAWLDKLGFPQHPPRSKCISMVWGASKACQPPSGTAPEGCKVSFGDDGAIAPLRVCAAMESLSRIY